MVDIVQQKFEMPSEYVYACLGQTARQGQQCYVSRLYLQVRDLLG